MITRKHVAEKLIFQILNKFGDSWGFLHSATEEGFQSDMTANYNCWWQHLQAD